MRQRSPHARATVTGARPLRCFVPCVRHRRLQPPHYLPQTRGGAHVEAQGSDEAATIASTSSSSSSSSSSEAELARTFTLFGHALRACAPRGEWRTATRLLSQLRDEVSVHGRTIGADCYTHAIVACSNSGQWARVLEIYREMEAAGVVRFEPRTTRLFALGKTAGAAGTGTLPVVGWQQHRYHLEPGVAWSSVALRT